ncbi:FAD-binding oxidoreductase [Aspergillus lucknowensis]|uniref:FAD-binding domain-containing protein n=1 Tax=Aspergillus lucknowensis TaxID=176173 RepID=A0ABR4LCB6_9EURO
MRAVSTTLGALGLLLCVPSTLALPSDVYAAFTRPAQGWDAETTINFPNTTGFDEATERWNTLDQPTFRMAITPAVEEDVARAVRIAKAWKLPFLATGGRHSSTTTLGKLQNGLAIDLSALNSVQVDADSETLTVGGGAVFGDIPGPVYEAGFQMPIGSCACPGMVGATVGGGLGRWQGVDGLIIDNLLSVRMVTANGRLIDVSETSHPDLFWAIRGAAPNFGIITSATYRLRPLTNGGEVFSADFVLPASANASYFDLLQSLEGTMPPELATMSIIVYNETLAAPQISLNWIYLGSEERGRELVAPIFALNPISHNITMARYDTITGTAMGGGGYSICDTVSLAGFGVSYRRLDAETYRHVFRMLSDWYVEYPDGRTSSVEIEIFAPQAVMEVGSTDTAYPWRDTLGYTGISFSGTSPETQEAGVEMGKVVRAAFAETGGYDGLATYVSYGHGDERLSEVFGENAPRLVELKKKWDPENVFRYFFSLATTPI